MSALVYVFSFLGLIFHPVIAAPTGLQRTLATTVPKALEPVVQGVFDFLDPDHAPSLNQTIVSCLALLFISVFAICPASLEVKAKRTSLRLRLVYGLTEALVGLLSPDFIAFTDYKNVLTDFSIATDYNLTFPTEDREKRWTGAHIAFIDHGGFVLQEAGKPAKVLSFGNLVRMIKAGEIERPDVSSTDILARSIRPSNSRCIISLVSFAPIYWFMGKFSPKLPLLVTFVSLHALLTWEILLVRSNATTGIKEPIVIVQKSQGESGSRDGFDKLGDEGLVEPADEEKVVEGMFLTAGPGEKDQRTTSSPDQTEHTLPGSSIMWLLASPFKLIGLVFHILLVSLSTMYFASKVSLDHQWAAMSGPRTLGTSGTYVAIMVANFVAWIGFVALSWQVSFPAERKIWIVPSLFLLLQPIVLLLVRPREKRMRMKESPRQVIYVLYSLVYVAARLSIPFAALYSTRNAMYGHATPAGRASAPINLNFGGCGGG